MTNGTRPESALAFGANQEQDVETNKRFIDDLNPPGRSAKACEFSEKTGQLTTEEMNTLSKEITDKILWHNDFQYEAQRRKLESMFGKAVESGEDSVKQLTALINNELKARSSNLQLEATFRRTINFASGRFCLMNGSEQMDKLVVIVPCFNYFK